jgi:hypothetical protein
MSFFIGVVEDVNDPTEKNRVRVRIFGKHTEDVTLIPTERLPWSNVVMPCTAGSVPGVGMSLGLVQGSWVVGMYIDKDENDTLIMGSLPSESTARPSGTGFQDPEGIHPRANTIDTPNIARSVDFEDDTVFTNKRSLFIEKIPVATPARCESLDSSGSDSYYENKSYDLLKPIDVIQPKYPANKVHKTEGGHCIEYDDTESYERISETHSPSGTYREIVADGSSTTVVKGDNYQVIHKNNNIYIKGNCNLTVDGEMRTLVQGDHHLEVEGNYTQKIHGNSHTSINLSEFKEVRREAGLNIGEDQTILLGKNRREVVNGNISFTCAKNRDIVVKGDQTNTTLGGFSITSSKNGKFSSPDKIHINSPVTRFSGDAIAGGAGVSLITHTHTQTNGSHYGGGTNTVVPNAGTGVGS